MTDQAATRRSDPMITPELRALQDVVRAFAHDVIAPQIGELYVAERFPYEIVAGLAEIGVFGLPFPEDVGGSGGDYFALCLAIEELARVDSSVAITVEAAVSLGAMPIHRFGTDEQRQRWLPSLCAGRSLGAFGLTEPGAGSDAGGTRTTARLIDGQWVINGTKAFITNSGTDLTAFVTVAAVTGVDPGGRKEISTIIVPTGTPGMTVAPKYSKVGWNCSDTHEIAFTDVRVPAENLLGRRGQGLAQFLSILDEGRIAISALAVGLAQGCLDESIAYANTRMAFGRPISSNQAIAFKIADMQLGVHTARLAYYDAAARMLNGEDFGMQAAMAKLYSSQVAVANAREATQIFGGYGFMNETPVARMWRDAKVLEIGEGTSEVQRMLIARHLGVEAG